MMKKLNLKKPATAGLLAMLCCFLWGSAFPCIKIGYRLFEIASEDTAAQLFFAGCRFTLAGVLTILFGSISGGKILTPKKESWSKILVLCLFQTILQYVLFYMGLAHTSGVKASIIGAANVFLSLLFAVFVFHFEKLTARKVAGCLIGFAGVVLVNLAGGGLDAGLSLRGEGAILGSSIASALSAGLIKKFSKKENPVLLSGYQFMIGGLFMVVLGFAMGGRVTVSGIGAVALLLYLAMVSAVAYTIWGILLKYHPVARISVFGFMNPIFGVLLSALLLGERNQAFGWQGILALVLVCTGIYVVNRTNAGSAAE